MILSKVKNILFFIFFFLLLFIIPIEHTEASEAKAIGNLKLGDRIIDLTWEWEYRTGLNSWSHEPFTGMSVTKPVIWVLVAKNHYAGGEAGSVTGGISHVTLITEELIGKMVFDNSTDRGGHNGSNHWGESGSPNATLGIRKLLNGSSYTGDDSNYYPITFYDTMSPSFRDEVLFSVIPNREWLNGTLYFTTDKVFLPSSTELGDVLHHNTYPIGINWDFFKTNEMRKSHILGITKWYWNRSPSSQIIYHVRNVFHDGSFLAVNHTAYSGNGVRPVINIAANAPVKTLKNADGLYEILDRSLLEEPYPVYLKHGYVLNGSKISVKDVVVVLRHIAGISFLSEDELARAMVSGKDYLALKDAILILRYIVGLIDSFPVEN